MTQIEMLAVALTLTMLSCTAPTEAPEIAPSPTTRRGYAAVCVPALGADLRGSMTDPWTPTCEVDEIPVPCELGTTCTGDACGCLCDHDGDCRGSLLGAEHISGSVVSPRSSVCQAGVCEWVAQP